MTTKGDVSAGLWSDHRFIAFDETPLFFRKLTPSLPSKAAIMIVHGMGEHSGRYLSLAEHFAGCGFTCYLPDLRGFGQSGAPRGTLKHFSDYYEDLAVLCRLAREKNDPGGLFFLGHSYGGLVVSAFLSDRPQAAARGLVLSSPNFGISIRVPIWRSLMAKAGSLIFPDYTQDNRVDAAFLTHDPEMNQKYRLDRLIHHRISARLYSELVKQLGRADEIASCIQAPALVLQAGDDRVVSRASTERFFRKMASPDKELKIYEGLYHEILNETTRYSIFETISRWMLSRV